MTITTDTQWFQVLYNVMGCNGIGKHWYSYVMAVMVMTLFKTLGINNIAF